MAQQENENIVSLIENCNDYAELQAELVKTLSSGYFLFTKSKKNIPNLSLLNCREEMTTSYRVDISSDGEITEWSNKPKVDPILYLTALPPPDLKQSQKLFQKSMALIISLANRSNQIKRDLQMLEKNENKSQEAEEENVEEGEKDISVSADQERE
jgi:hypothetical protein